MGRRSRLHREAVVRGLVPSYRELRARLMREVVRLASPELFHTDHDHEPIGKLREEIAPVLVGWLPRAMVNTGVHQFSTYDITRSKDWGEMCSRIIQGVLSRDTEKFRKTDTRGEVWALRKRRGGRRAAGVWVFCLGCGVARYNTPSRQTKRCRECWKREAGRGRGKGVAP